MKKFNELNKIKTLSTVTLLLFTTPVALNGILLSPTEIAHAQETVNQPNSKTNQSNSSLIQSRDVKPSSTDSKSSSSQTRTTSSTDDKDKDQDTHRSSFFGGWWWFWVGRHFGSHQPYRSSYFQTHGGKYNESKMTSKEKDKLNSKHGAYISRTGNKTEKSKSTTTAPKEKSKGANVHDSKSSGKSSKSSKSSKSGKSSSHGGIGGHNGSHGTSHGG